MVDILSNLGARLGVGAFYISFILAPLASNAAEVEQVLPVYCYLLFFCEQSVGLQTREVFFRF